MPGQFDHLNKVKSDVSRNPDDFINGALQGKDDPNKEKKRDDKKNHESNILITTKGRHNRKKSEAFNLFIPKELDDELQMMTAGNKQVVLNYLLKSSWELVKKKNKLIVVNSEDL